MDVLMNIIDTFGFPVACVIMLFWQTEQLRKQNQEQTNMWYKALQENTATLAQLVTRLEELQK